MSRQRSAISTVLKCLRRATAATGTALAAVLAVVPTAHAAAIPTRMTSSASSPYVVSTATSPGAADATAPQALSQGSPFDCGPYICYIQCMPYLSGGAFPHPGTQATGNPPGLTGFGGTCGRSYSWGYTVSGTATGQAEWDSVFGGGLNCRAFAFIPDNHSNDPNAQYYLWDGNRYLANDASFNQESLTNQFGGMFKNTDFFRINENMRVTLSDHNPNKQPGWNIAADAMIFQCYQGPLGVQTK
jgi:hypothetical protein